MGSNTVAFWTTAPLPYLLITVKVIELEKVSLVRCKILRLFVNTLTAYDNYSLFNRENLTQPIQILLSQKQKTFSEFFSAFLKSLLSCKPFQAKDDSDSRCITEITGLGKGD